MNIVSDSLLVEAFNKEINSTLTYAFNSFYWPYNKNHLVCVTLNLTQYEEKFNSYKTTGTYQQSPNYLVKIPKYVNAWDSITVACVDASKDIKAINLYLTASDFDNNTKYVLVKQLLSPQSNKVTFADRPILNETWFDYVIEIEYHDHFKIDPSILSIEIEQYHFISVEDIKQHSCNVFNKTFNKEVV